MWIRRYNKAGEFTQSVQFSEEGEVKSYYAIEGKEYVKYNVWGDDKEMSFQVADEEIKLDENKIGAQFFRGVSKNNNKGGINYPKFNKHLAIVNGDIINFNIDKSKLQQWKTKAKKQTYPKGIKTT
jgi:hypothetical protein